MLQISNGPQNKCYASIANNTAIVTVTYGDRGEYVYKLARQALQNEGVGSLVVVNNASRADFKPLKAQWGDSVKVVDLETNTGSANGYAEGITKALSTDSDYIWLLDDDNFPVAGALDKLHRALEELSQIQGKGKAAVQGFRADHQFDIAAGIKPKYFMPLPSSYFGFHIAQVPYKLWKRIRLWKLRSNKVPKTINLPFAPYGGFLAHREVYRKIGVPDKRLVLYVDDTEYTYRLTSCGGKIRLVTDAVLEDLEDSWNIKRNFRSYFEILLNSGSDFRAYYNARNQAWFDRYKWSSNGAVYTINRAIFLFFLSFNGILTGKRSRMVLLRRAIADGEKGNLGISPLFPLDESMSVQNKTG